MFMLIMANVYTILIVLMGQVVNVYVDSGECLYMIGRVGWAVNVLRVVNVYTILTCRVGGEC